MDSLVTILADMLRSALTWEQNDNSEPPGGYEGELTGTSQGLYTNNAQSRQGGEHHDDNKDTHEAEPNDDLRGPERA